MPHYLYGCDSCGSEFDVLTTISDNDKERCPKCGSIQVARRFAAASYAGDYESFALKWAKMDPLEREAHLDNKNMLESRAAEILSGEVVINERGPKELRPRVPEHLTKRYY